MVIVVVIFFVISIRVDFFSSSEGSSSPCCFMEPRARHPCCVRPRDWWCWIYCCCAPHGWRTDVSAVHFCRRRWPQQRFTRQDIMFCGSFLRYIVRLYRDAQWFLLESLFIADASTSSLCWGGVVPNIDPGEDVV